jgi:hypothetical protein
MSERASWLNADIGPLRLLIGATGICAVVLVAAMLIADRSDFGKVLSGAGFVLFLSLWTPVLPVLGLGVQMLPSVPQGLASVLVGILAIAIIATALISGLRLRRTWYGKALSLGSVAAWILWGIACIPPA